MCHFVREQQAAAEAGPGAPVAGTDFLRPPKWAGAAALALVGGLALAAYVDLRPPAAEAQARTAAPEVSPAAAAPRVAEPTAGLLPVDDDVPTPGGMVRAGAGPCHHDL